MHASDRRPSASWPAALLPGALLLALLTAGAGSVNAGESAPEISPTTPVTELYVVDGS